ncbi:3-hydroxyanthranilate 3,4-dioxygenase [Taibaiella soli]|uniref:3-hydroxyanthranilate 3,4-dioxygenase n=1 Tax=Taibaiella soli TaxID=1649169 RepID=A0A2W2AKK1_9BACT|nr:3-hydroxyanthranilate 3,4-dioxygenase [Taibaiella soli]PZF74112.1 3-hydroxyanthranilate 3,4-dioxygenase [Taibaiella soli]
MPVTRPFNIHQWIEENRSLLKPPVGNATLYKNTGDFIVMVVGGPNSRKDFHYNESEELFYQLEGDIVVRIQEDGKIVDIPIKQGEIFLLPGKTPHSPQRGENTVGLVIEKVRQGDEIDGFLWFCENCDEKLYEEYMKLTDIVTQLPPVMQRFYDDVDKRTCKHCGTVMEPPAPKK